MSRHLPPVSSHVSLALLMLSFVGARDCLGGKVSLGDDGKPHAAGGSSAGSASTAAGSPSVAGRASGAGDVSDVLDAGVGPTETVLIVDPTGYVTSSPALGVSGAWYPFADSWGLDGSNATGDCELAGHIVSQCAQVSTPQFGPFTNVGGRMCTAGIAESVLAQINAPAELDYGAMWGAGIGFGLNGAIVKTPYDATAHGVIGVTFDIDHVPPSGIRVEFPTPATANNPAAWSPNAGTPNFTSPVSSGHNVILFSDVAEPSYVLTPSGFDPTQILAMHFHVPTTSVAGSYAFCISNVALVTGTAGSVDAGSAVSGECPPSLRTETGFQYVTPTGCISPYSTVLDCSTLDNQQTTIPNTPAIATLPCARRLLDGALFLALPAGTQPLDWTTAPRSSWSRLAPGEWADCSAAEAIAMAGAALCPVLPVP
jgi:hypothetical protein